MNVCMFICASHMLGTYGGQKRAFFDNRIMVCMWK